MTALTPRAAGPHDSGSAQWLIPATGGEFAELPPPDPSEYEGANRLVNLWVGPAGETMPIDVWGRRTFTNGPILLAEDVGFGESTDYFSAPPGYSLAVVGAGAGGGGGASADPGAQHDAARARSLTQAARALPTSTSISASAACW